MKKGIGLFKSISKNRAGRIAFFFISMGVILGGYIAMKYRLDHVVELAEDDYSWVYQVEETEVQDGELVINGWAFEQGENTALKDYEIVLYDAETGKGYFPKMEYGEREDVNRYFACEADYTKSGFKAMIAEERLKDDVYEILLKPKGTKKCFATGAYYADGELAYVHPEEMVEPDVEGTELEDIVKNGIFRTYLADIGIYVYQYEGKLHYLMEEKYLQQPEYLNRIVTCLYTVKSEEVLKTVEYEWEREDIDSYFDDVVRIGHYYITNAQISLEYPTYKIEFGNYNNGHWVWTKSIRPLYELQ